MQVILKKQAIPYKLRFIEEADVVKKMKDDEYERLKPNIEIKGFRKGHVPREEADKHLDKYQLYRGVFDKMYMKAIEEQNLHVVDARDFEVIGQFDDKSPLVMQAIVYLRPKVESFDINKVNVVKKMTEVTNEMIDQQIKILQDKDAKFTPVTDISYTVKTGDAMIIDYEGKINGVAFQGGTAKKFRYVVGETKFIPGFEEQLLAMKVNIPGTVKVQFPENYYSSDLKGKDAEFAALIHKIDSKSVKTVEELARPQTIEEYRESIKQKLIQDHARIDEESFESDVLAACISSAEIEATPDIMVNHELDNEWNQFLYRMGTNEEDYLKKHKEGKDAFYAQTRKRVEKTIETRVFLDYICEVNKIEVTREEVETFVKERSTKLQKSDAEKQSILENLKKDVNYKASETAVKHEKAATMLVNKIRDREIDVKKA
jgi:trigger factor